MDKARFKERVRKTVIECSKKYKENFVDYEYLICSEGFSNGYYIVKANEDNYQHLTGVNSLISPQEFFVKSYNGTLSENDFDFVKIGQTEKSVKGSVREKIKVLHSTMDLFMYKDIFVEESFHKNKVFCSFATAIPAFTLGFFNGKYAVPKSLLKNNQLRSNDYKVELIIRKHRLEKEFHEIVLGTDVEIKKYYDKIKNLISVEFADLFSQCIFD